MFPPQTAGRKRSNIRHPGGKHRDDHIEHPVIASDRADREQRFQGSGDQNGHAVNHAGFPEGDGVMIQNQRTEQHNGIHIVGDRVPEGTGQKGRDRRKHKARRQKDQFAGQTKRLHNFNHGKDADHRHRNVQRQWEDIVEDHNRREKQDQERCGNHS